MMKERIGNWCETFTGRAFWPLDPRPDEVCIEDIAHALAMQCRFGGHCAEFYSVAEHSVRVSRLVPRGDQFAALLHDAAEAYLVDLPRPIKRSMPTYTNAETWIAGAIGEHFGVELIKLPESVKLADEIMLATEKRDLMVNSALDWGWLPDPDRERIRPMGPKEAKTEFLARFHMLSRDARSSAVTMAPEGRAEIPTLVEVKT